jgi:hypothetical protein
VVATVVAAIILGGFVGAGCGSSDSSSATDAYCARIAQVGARDLLSDPAPTQVRHDLTMLLDLTRRAAAVAPDEIRSDAREAASAQARFNALYAAHGWQRRPTLTDPAFQSLAGDQHLAAVYTRLERYQIKSCHGGGDQTATVAPA